MSTLPESSAPQAEPTTSPFESFALDPRILEAVRDLGFTEPTPIQVEAMPPLLRGQDVIGGARTGSGKTAAFGLPLLEKVKEGGSAVRALVLAPTRELALQVTDAIRSYAKHLPIRLVTIYGGASYRPQLDALRRGVTVVVGTPGRVLDHVDRGTLDLSSLELLVLDEADEMLRMGFIEDVERVLEASPKGRQIALFSATMPPPIRRVAASHLRDPLAIQVEQSALTVEHIAQRWLLVPQLHKFEALQRVLAGEERGTTLIFARTRAGCAEIADKLAADGISVDALHGDLNQAARERVLLRLRNRRLDVVVATDVAARGIDVDHITHVLNLDLPIDPEIYVHRIGRTGRAGRAGSAISFITPGEMRRLRILERAVKMRIEPMPVPTDADIALRKVARLREKIIARGAEEPSERALELARSLIEDGDSAEQVLADALRVLADAEGMNLDRKPDASAPAWSRPQTKRLHEKPRREKPGHESPRYDRPRGDRPAHLEDHGESPRAREPRPPRVDAADEVELFLPVGSRRGVRPGDLVGALANDAGIPGAQIGRITIGENKSFLRLPREAAEHVLREHSMLNVRGKDVPVSKARVRPPIEAGARPPIRAKYRPGGPPPTRGLRPKPKSFLRKK